MTFWVILVGLLVDLWEDAKLWPLCEDPPSSPCLSLSYLSTQLSYSEQPLGQSKVRKTLGTSLTCSWYKRRHHQLPGNSRLKGQQGHLSRMTASHLGWVQASLSADPGVPATVWLRPLPSVFWSFPTGWPGDMRKAGRSLPNSQMRKTEAWKGTET